jgi:hypothetical protein
VQLNVPSIIGELYDLLNEAASGEDSTRLQKSFDRLRQLADDAAMIYRTYVIDERAKWQGAVNQLESSMSWRATAPLRWMNRFFNL